MPNRIRYTGQQYDNLTEQYYLRARYYNPVLGRFMQEDVYQGDGLNMYAYCGNNPVVYADPSGYAKKCTDSNIDNGTGKENKKTSQAVVNLDDNDANLPNRRQAFNLAKDRADVPRSQQPVRQWRVGDDINLKGLELENYKYDANPGSHGRYYEYVTPNGKVVIVDHTNDGVPHFHAGEPKIKDILERFAYDFKKNKYLNIFVQGKDKHIYYDNG